MKQHSFVCGCSISIFCCLYTNEHYVWEHCTNITCENTVPTLLVRTLQCNCTAELAILHSPSQLTLLALVTRSFLARASVQYFWLYSQHFRLTQHVKDVLASDMLSHDMLLNTSRTCWRVTCSVMTCCSTRQGRAGKWHAQSRRAAQHVKDVLASDMLSRDVLLNTSRTCWRVTCSVTTCCATRQGRAGEWHAQSRRAAQHVKDVLLNTSRTCWRVTCSVTTCWRVTCSVTACCSTRQGRAGEWHAQSRRAWSCHLTATAC